MIVLRVRAGSGSTSPSRTPDPPYFLYGKGIDGRIYFHEGDGTTRQVILSVKAGKLHAPYVRDLRGVVEREKAALGALLTLDEPTQPMRTEAASAGFYVSPWGSHPRLQIVTVGELLAGGRIDMPTRARYFRWGPHFLLTVNPRRIKTVAWQRQNGFGLSSTGGRRTATASAKPRACWA